MNDTDLVLLVPAWDSGIDMLRDWGLRSLMQPGNLPALINAGVKLHLRAFTKAGQEGQLANVLRDVPFASASYRYGPNPELIMCHHGPKAAFEKGYKALLCVADQIWGNGSISNMWRYAKGKDVVVATPHLRVVESRWKWQWAESDLSFPLPNRALVQTALHPAVLHASQKAWSTEHVNTTHNSGISLTRLAPDLVSLIHFLPTPFLCSFNGDDVAFFSAASRPVYWDREWPSIVLARERWRVIGSSEIAFGVELSAEHSTAAPEAGRQYFEGYYEDRPHHRTCGSFVCLLHL